MKKMLIITPHLSTGGAPQFTLSKIEMIKNDYEILCIEYDFVAPEFVVQRNKISNLLGNNFVSLGDNKRELVDILNWFNPDIISMEEFPEFFMGDSIVAEIYKENKNYVIFEIRVH